MVSRSWGERGFALFNVALMLFVIFVTLYPFVNMLAISLNEGLDTARGGITIWPRRFTTENYQIALRYPSMRTGFIVSVGRTIGGVLYHMFLICTAAYALKRRNLPFRSAILVFFIVPMFVNPGLIPTYLNIRNLGLLNSFLVYVLPFGWSFYNFIIIRTFMQGIPDSLEESAFIDGAGHFTVFSQIILPLAKPAIAAVSLFIAVTMWNEWFSSMVYVTRQSLWTLQYLLQRVLRDNMAEEIVDQVSYLEQQIELRTYTPTSIQMAVVMVTTAPILIVYPFLQKHFVKGVMLGAVKG